MAQTLIESDSSSVAKRLCAIVEKTANEAIALDDIFKIGLSGSSMVHLLAEGLPSITTDWSKWRFFFCDERVVPLDHGDSTYGEYKKHLLPKIPVTEDQFIRIDPDLSAEEAAKDYIKKMSVYFPPDSLPRFDLLLLGMGPDGHTCSLFPNHRLLDETSLWVAPINDSPKPPPSRITLTFPVINNAKVCAFPITGSGKANMIKRILKDKENLPAGRVQPTNGQLYWILDEDAAKQLDS
ncbi:6-phosphogluconolactonase [Orussus abietinus]|uniref:6-phosphogluconolactonase n=1 Tax=Orussus abietinus TaxID=222816 RepID=UPI00062540B2|nr:6-phosphogluconolactonase [Orussus abietinus]XP_012286699.1 6-phosphogluconolactonase [Orussus abietinus]